MTVRFDVGGRLFRTSLETLRESDFLHNLATGDWSEGLETEPIFIDRDDFLFGYILMYLRTGDFNIDKQHYQNLKNEADFFLLPRMSEKIDLLIEETRPKKMVYELIDEERLRVFSEIDVHDLVADRKSRNRCVGFNKTYIAAIKCLVQVYTCPRGVVIHKDRWRCGRACMNAMSSDSNGYAAREITMYLVSTEE